MQLRVRGKGFNDMLVESIDETISEMLSREVLNALYIHLEKFHSVSKAEIPYRLETLFTTLEKTFGGPSSRVISKAIARKLCLKFDLPFEASGDSGQTLLECIDEAKKQLGGRTNFEE